MEVLLLVEGEGECVIYREMIDLLMPLRRALLSVYDSNDDLRKESRSIPSDSGVTMKCFNFCRDLLCLDEALPL